MLTRQFRVCSKHEADEKMCQYRTAAGYLDEVHRCSSIAYPLIHTWLAVLCLSMKVDKLLRQYEGKYAELFRKLEAKYARPDPRKQVGLTVQHACSYPLVMWDPSPKPSSFERVDITNVTGGRSAPNFLLAV